MITIAATFHCVGAVCESTAQGKIEVQFLVSQGRPCGEQLRPHVPAGWSVVANESRIQAAGAAGPQIGPLGFICTACTKVLKAKAEAKSRIVSA